MLSRDNTCSAPESSAHSKRAAPERDRLQLVPAVRLLRRVRHPGLGHVLRGDAHRRHPGLLRNRDRPGDQRAAHVPRHRVIRPAVDRRHLQLLHRAVQHRRASGAVLAIIPRLAAAFNRSTLLTDSDQPDGENPAGYYANAITNHYARIVHATEAGGLGYAFPYDDVTPDGGVNQAGPVSSGSPALLSVTVGPVH